LTTAINLTLRRAALTLVIHLAAAAATATAQQAPVRPDSTRAQIQGTLRAFYFNLAHNDWEALAADILPAKVVAHRSVPARLVMPAPSGDGAAVECSSPATPSIDGATITLDGDWAEVSVPRCAEPRGADEFRLIRFERRWRFVYIDLFQRPLHLVTEQ
jgi:hypothetical protein